MKKKCNHPSLSGKTGLVKCTCNEFFFIKPVVCIAGTSPGPYPKVVNEIYLSNWLGDIRGEMLTREYK